jgi:hypothetical protein
VPRVEVTGDSEDFESQDIVYELYTEFVAKEGLDEETKSKFTTELKKKGGITDGRRRIKGVPEPVYTGINLD